MQEQQCALSPPKSPLCGDVVVVVVRHGYYKRHPFRDSKRGCETYLIGEMEDETWLE
jgi:hypothetical protein